MLLADVLRNRLGKRSARGIRGLLKVHRELWGEQRLETMGEDPYNLFRLPFREALDLFAEGLGSLPGWLPSFICPSSGVHPIGLLSSKLSDHTKVCGEAEEAHAARARVINVMFALRSMGSCLSLDFAITVITSYS